MDFQKKTFKIIYDIIGIVTRWDKHLLSDREAIKEIVEILNSEAENDEEITEPIKKKKSSSYFKVQKKLVAPVAISAVFIVILFVAVSPFTNVEDIETNIPVEDKDIGFEQLEEKPSDIKEKTQNKTVVEEFSNLTNSNLKED